MAATSLSLRQRIWNPEARLAYLLLLPTVVFLAAFMFYPIIYVFVMSFFRTNKLSALTKFVGVKNFIGQFQDTEFWWAALRSLIWTSIGVSTKFLLGMTIAVLLNVKYRGRKVARMAFIIPWASSVPISALLWKLVYHPDFGLLNRTLSATGIWRNPPGWVGSPIPAFAASMWVDVWIGIPFFALVFLAGMQAIPQELYESAHMDGAGSWRSYFSITLPGLRELILISTLLSAIWTFNDFNVIYILTGAGPASTTNILITSVYIDAFVERRFDWASVQSVVTFVILSIVSVVYARFYFRQENA